MVTIENLTVEFEVEGSSEEAAFAALFRRHIDEWKKRQEEAKEREKRAESSRRVVGHGTGGDR